MYALMFMIEHLKTGTSHLQHRQGEEVAQLLMPIDCHPERNSSKQAAKIEDVLCCKLWTARDGELIKLNN